jgi:hypothetical protein
MENIYEKLRARLDELATGYPETESKEWMKGLPGTMKKRVW